MSAILIDSSLSFGPSVKLPQVAIHDAFVEMAERYPDFVAAKHAGQQMTYSELDQLSDHLAAELERMESRPGDNVGLFLERSIPMLVGIMGILKSGSAYVPQDARITPTTSLSHIADTSGIKIILTLSHLKHRIPQSKGVKVIELDRLIEKFRKRAPLKVKPNVVNPTGLCFILFTSGTTGLPNGVKVGHLNVCNLLLTEPGNLRVKPGQTVSQILNISFDMCAWEIFAALSHGGKLFIREKSIREAVSKADVVIATPSILSTVPAHENKHVKVVAVAGEPCPRALAESWSDFSDFYNCCGPTETTIVNTMKLYEKGVDKISIGKPTPNNTVYILDENLKPLAPGEIGEMWAGGDCVTHGYINSKKLTSERYLEDPFLGEGKMMFRTRDLGRWNSDGELEHFGRTDDQVKIKGFRVELDSISTVLERVAECTQAITLKLDSQNLVSFVTPEKIGLHKAKKAMEEILPYYCIPKFIVPMESFPKTSRGKIDKKALTILAVKIQEEIKSRESASMEVAI